MGSKVRFSPRCPKDIKAQLRGRTRTVIDYMYDPDHACCYYEIGRQGKGSQGYLLRSYMLIPAEIGQKCRYGNKKIRYSFRLARQNDKISDFMVECMR